MSMSKIALKEKCDNPKFLAAYVDIEFGLISWPILINSVY